jgi:hypothetical protein
MVVSADNDRTATEQAETMLDGVRVHPSAVAAGHDAHAIVFDFVNPTRTAWRSLSG